MILVLQSLWNQSLTDSLAKEAIKTLEEQNFSWKLIQVPGALELPLALKWAYESHRSGEIEAAVACGVVIKGDTYHFEMVANESARGLSDLSLQFGIPVGHAVLATYTIEQAQARSSGSANKGREGALAVIEMLRLKQKLKSF